MQRQTPLHLDIQILPIQSHYFLSLTPSIHPTHQSLFIDKTFILFILELRSGMTLKAINVLKRCLLDFCQEGIEKGLDAIGFVINGEYFTIKRINYQAIKQILQINLNISQNDDYLITLRKLRHVLQSDIYKYDKVFSRIDMIFFTSYVQVDHTLGVKKRSYIQQLNQHSSECFSQVNRIQKVLKKQCLSYNSHIIALQKRGYSNQDYSLADRDLYNCIHTRLGKFYSLIFLLWVQDQTIVDYQQQQKQVDFPKSFSQVIEAFRKIKAMVITMAVALQVSVPIVDEEEKIRMQREKYLCLQDQQGLDQSEEEEMKHIKEQVIVQKVQNKIVKHKQKYSVHYFYTQNFQKFTTSQKISYPKSKISLQLLQTHCKVTPKTRLNLTTCIQPICSITTSYRIPSISQSLFYKISLFNKELQRICQQLKNQIISFKRIYDGNGKSHIEMNVDEEKQTYIRDRIFYIEGQAKVLFQHVFDRKIFPANDYKQTELKRQAFQSYSSLKKKLDISQEVLMTIYKKQITGNEIGRISSAVTFWGIRNSLKTKLIRRINLNPFMLDQVASKVHNIVQQSNYDCLQTKQKNAKHAIGPCIKSGINFATALRKQDCLAILIEIQRPDAAIADPGRIKIRQISPFSISVNQFFNKFYYGLQGQSLDRNQGNKFFQPQFKQKVYKDRWDYWGIMDNKKTVPALIPVYLCKEHWDVAKLLMKPCLGWTATGEPLGYTFMQFQTIPFMVLSFAIRRVQEITYHIREIQYDIQMGLYQVTKYSKIQDQLLTKKRLLIRMKDLCWVLEGTCFQIVKDLSWQGYKQNFSDNVIQKYMNYVKFPIQRTVDIIPNNSAFLSQVYCVISLKLLPLPKQQQFHQFFKRLVQQQLRRQTLGFYQQQSETDYINKLLNSQIQKMDIPQYVILNSQYYDNFQLLRKGQLVQQTYFQIKRNQLEMMLKTNGMFNNTQKMCLIQYKRLYENRVLWMWYVRFRLYHEVERRSIHKWKCLDLINSYKLFTMIIQNKKQRKNAKRREAILNNQYVDPFDYYTARDFLQQQFTRLRASKQSHNIHILQHKKYNNAAKTFCQTLSLQQAAGTLINFIIGQHCRIFYQEIVKGDGLRIEEKLRMLMMGEFMGVRLCNGWKIGKKKNNLLRDKYQEVFLKHGYMF